MRDWSELGGEYALIGRIVQALQRTPAFAPLMQETPQEGALGKGVRLLEGIGDDAAILQLLPVHGEGRGFLLCTADMLVEGVHFRADWIDARSLGWKSLTVNLSDIAAMGGTPLATLLSLALPPERTGAWLDDFVEGFLECAARYGTLLIGGDTNRAEHGVVDVMVLGQVEATPVRRRGARPGDWILVTGALGGSRAGLEWLMHDSPTAVPIDLTPHFRPVPRLQEGQLAAQLGASAMMDISDGLASDLPKLLWASEVGGILYPHQIPVHPEALRWAQAQGADPALFAMAGGEDYELLITAPPEVAQQMLQRIPAETGTPLTHIGQITAENRLWLEYPDGRREPLTVQGWNHFL
jgi:thiamine-monophosphate kinase